MNKQRFYAPGRVEIGGNHTDHQHGRVLAAAIGLRVGGAAAANGTNIINIQSEGFGSVSVDLSDLSAKPEERGTVSALIRGVAAKLSAYDYAVGGFDMSVKSDIPVGMGFSSSAAFETLIGRVFSGFFNNNSIPALEIALSGQYAENVYFGKPCGLMDQCASSFGGLVMIDFENPENPVVTRLNATFAPYAVCAVDTGGSHADLTGDYAAIPREMAEIAGFFGKTHLRRVAEEDFYAQLPKLRQFGDRAVLRAAHFFAENERVPKQAQALINGDMAEFLALVNQSGESSLKYLQNCTAPANPREQGITLALALSEKFLDGQGAARVHGGGFAGSILAFVPEDMEKPYKARMEAVFGENSCRTLEISNG